MPSSLPHRQRNTDRPLRYLAMLGRAAAHVDAHLDAPLDAAILAEQAAMSRHHFHRLFHAHFGLTVNGYLTWRRLRHACERLAQTSMPVLDIALEAGFGSSQALAKATQRELGLTPTQVRNGQPVPWPAWFAQQRVPEEPLSPQDGRAMLQPRWTVLPDLEVLTAKGSGMRNGHLTAAVQQAFGELVPALSRAGWMPRVTRCISFLTEAPRGPDDPHCVMRTGALFGHDPLRVRGKPERPDIELTGSLQWWSLPGGRCAVFTHVGPYARLHDLWAAIYRHWVPATGQRLRDTPGFDLYVDDPRNTPVERLRTALFLPIH